MFPLGAGATIILPGAGVGGCIGLASGPFKYGDPSVPGGKSVSGGFAANLFPSSSPPLGFPTAACGPNGLASGVAAGSGGMVPSDGVVCPGVAAGVGDVDGLRPSNFASSSSG